MHTRHRHRLPGFDYSTPGAYFVTICAHGNHLFGKITNGEMKCNALGDLVTLCWNEIPGHFPLVSLDAFVAMPDHVHGVLLFADVEHGRARTLSAVIGSFKAAVSKKAGATIWQRSYWERVVRNERELNIVRHYVEENPQRWEYKNT